MLLRHISIRFSVLLSISMLVLSACDGGNNSAGSSNNSENTEADTVQSNSAQPKYTDRPNFVVLSLPSYTPFTGRNNVGELVGMDIDILRAIGERENFTLTFLPHPAKGLLEVLESGQADIVASGMHITQERLEKYDFSKPYFEAKWAALLDGSKGRLKSFADLRGKTIAVPQNSLSVIQLESTGITDKILPVISVYLGRNQIIQGNADAVYDIDSVLKTYANQDKNYYILPDEQSGKILLGFAVVKGNTALKTKIDRGLDKIRADGTYQKIINKWQNGMVGAVSSDYQEVKSASEIEISK